ncbi:MAG: phosphatidylserine/phosphatidylglycerophosphate/cardiolipin synthase family protein [Candidatus Riflebacteria bacterium]|nr:phosphatidylserine/phosphatidylglycerophosphate/cardiolipin synthase family protein [Candidatus Riflebacteria bacterium]
MKIRRIILILPLTALFFTATLVTASQSGAYNSYLSAYQAYKEAVSSGMPSSEIEVRLKAYLGAKAVYESEIRTPNTDINYQAPVANNAESSSLSEKDSATLAGSLSDYGDRLQDLVTSGASNLASRKKTIALPKNLKHLIDKLWSDNIDEAKKALSDLEAYAESVNSEELKQLALYEVAKGYDYIMDDMETSKAVLAKLISMRPTSKIGKLAQERITYLSEKKTSLNMKQRINEKFKVTDKTYKDYKKVSWALLPYKLTKWTSYASSNMSFTKAQNDYTKSMLEYEARNARFAPPVNVVFNTFKPEINREDPATVRLIYSNPEAWYARWKIIEEAKDTIDVQYFILGKDTFGYSLLGLLLKKAEEGVKIRMLLDSRGTKDFARQFLGQEYLQRLALSPNIEIRIFSPVTTNIVSMFHDPRKILASNHDKILIVDGQYSIMGGRNLSKEYYLDKRDNSGSYVDCDILIDSALVAKELKIAFDGEYDGLKVHQISSSGLNRLKHEAKLRAAHDTMFAHISKDKIRPLREFAENRNYIAYVKDFYSEVKDWKYLRNFGDFVLFADCVEAPVKIMDKHSMHGPLNEMTDNIVKYIDGSQTEIFMQNPYVVFTDRIFAALKRADKKGVSIILATNSPASTDNPITQAMFVHDWKDIFRQTENFRIYAAKEQKLHAKNWLFDRKISLIGSYNLDPMSEDINSEIAAAVNSIEFAKQLRKALLEYISEAAEYHYIEDEQGNVVSSVGPDDYKGKSTALLKILSWMQFIRPLV